MFIKTNYVGDMLMTDKEFKKICRNFWGFIPIFPFDSEFINITKNDLEKELQIKKVNPPGDCDDWALQLYAAVKYDHPKWPFGRAVGIFNNRIGPHAVNICICDNEIYLIEPKNNSIWKANSKKDKIKFVEV